MAVRVGVDIGGTFTDVALESDGRLISTKVLTDYAAPQRAVVEATEKVATEAGVAPGDIAVVIHGTTLATNALIERRGAKTAFITTEGYRDVIEMRTENRFEQYDLYITLPKPLVARRHRYTVGERIDAGGNVLRPIDVDEVDALATKIANMGYESVAIGFIHAYANGAHERRVRDALRARLPDLSISISSEVAPQMREFERFNTVVANAYVKPLMARYLHNLVDELRGIGVACPVYVIHSGGGIITIDTAAEFPVRLVESGPAGGAIFAADIAARYDLDRVLSFDMGGTTAKICLIENQAPQTAKTFEVARTYRFKKGSGMPIAIPVIEMVEIGAGGGSIASVDSLRQIRVGPESAGSEPGPASYQRGGDKPAVTDADLVLGRIDPENFAGGSIPLSQPLAETAVSRDVGRPLDMDPLASAYGISEVVDENMANAARVHAVENGKEIGAFTMIAFGGAAPIHAARLAEKLGIRRYLVPPGAGVGSAIGFLRAPFGYEAVQSRFLALADYEADLVNDILDGLERSAAAIVEEGTGGRGEVQRQKTAYMRYRGQGWEIPVDLAGPRFGPDDAATLKSGFEEAYTRLFGRPIDGLDIEIVSWSVRVSSIVPPPVPVAMRTSGTLAEPSGKRRLFDPAKGAFTSADVYDRFDLAPGHSVEGPSVIVERETATIVPAGCRTVVQSDGCLLVERETDGS